MTLRDEVPKGKKYELVKDQTINVDGRTLCRIRARKEFGDVKAGDLGGFVESEKNLSQEGECWVGGNAVAFDEAFVGGEARVFDSAVVGGHAKVIFRARVFENARVGAYARVGGYCRISGHAEVGGNMLIGGETEVGGDEKLTGDDLVVVGRPGSATAGRWPGGPAGPN